MGKGRTGFSLAELMIVVAVIGLIAGIAAPKFAGLLERAKEAEIKSSLGAFRSAITLYYSTTEGLWPADRDGLVPVFLAEIPFIGIPGEAQHPKANGVRSDLDDWAGGDAWVYNDTSGFLHVNCSHADSSARVWSTM